MKPTKTINTIGIIVLIITGLNALAAGFSMIVEPSGKDLGMSVGSILQHSPFHSFLIPGITLFTTIGLFSMVTALSILKKWKRFELLIMLQGVILTGWIFFQVIFLRQFNWMHATFGIIGILIFWWGYVLYHKEQNMKAGF